MTNEVAEAFHVTGIVRGAEFDSRAKVLATESSLRFDWLDALPWTVALSGIDGIATHGDTLTLFLQGGDVLELRSVVASEKSAAALIAVLYTLPEMTRGLRSLGSLRGALGASHDRWFAPLLSARKDAASSVSPERHMLSFNAAKLASEQMRAIEEIAATIAPTNAAHRRAVEAVLEEEAEQYFAALHELNRYAELFNGSAEDSRFRRWREWVNQLRTVFSLADESWLRCSEVLD